MSEDVNRQLAQSSHGSGRSTRRRWPAYLLLIAGLAAILAGLSWQTIQERFGAPVALSDQSLGLPARLTGIPASQPQFGADALKTIESMHGKGFPIVSGAVVHYGSATVWVAQANDEAGARAMTGDMTARIAGGRSPFRPVATRRVNGRTVYALEGIGQSHFYWQSGAKVTWLAIDPGPAETGLQELVRAIN